jgi:hypothetical protein
VSTRRDLLLLLKGKILLGELMAKQQGLRELLRFSYGFGARATGGATMEQQ